MPRLHKRMGDSATWGLRNIQLVGTKEKARPRATHSPVIC